ncbi:MAG: transcription termination/antitermination protein NusG [Bryobacteraceae bacterium]
MIHTDIEFSPCSSLPWYGLRTKSKHEYVAAKALEGQGYESYLPLHRRRRQWSDRVVESEQPLFPGYVFCRFNAQQRMPILATLGIVSIVGFGNGPVAIADLEIEAVQTLLRSGAVAQTCPFICDGERVRIDRGALEGLEGILLQNKNEWRVVISVTMLQRSIAVEVDREWTNALGEPVRKNNAA